VKGFFKFLLWVAILLMVAYLVASWLLVDFVEIGQNDMAPTLAQGDFFVLYRHATPTIGDVLVCEHPSQPGRPIAGRLVAKAGQKVAIRRGMLVVDGRPLDTDVPSPDRFHLVDRARSEDMDLLRRREFVGQRSWIVSYKDTHQPLEMPERVIHAGYFLLSDNRSYGVDSRNFGEFDPSMCRGVAFFVLTTGTGNGDLDRTASERSFSPIH
jgi:signal peptidase I